MNPTPIEPVGMAGLFKPTYQPSSTRTITVNNSKYKPLLDLCQSLFTLSGDKLWDELLRSIPSIETSLSPLDIQHFLEQTIAFETEQSYCSVVGKIATKLIENSYHDDHDTFRFHLEGFPPLDWFGYGITPIKNKTPPTIIVHGKLGNYAFWSSRCKYFVQESDHSFNPFPSYFDSIGYVEREPLMFSLPSNAGVRSSVSLYTITTVQEKLYTCYRYYQMHSPDVGRFILLNEYEYKNSSIKYGNDFTLTDQPVLAASLKGVISQDVQEFQPTEFEQHWQPAVQAFETLERVLRGGNP